MKSCFYDREEEYDENPWEDEECNYDQFTDPLTLEERDAWVEEQILITNERNTHDTEENPNSRESKTRPFGHDPEMQGHQAS